MHMGIDQTDIPSTKPQGQGSMKLITAGPGAGKTRRLVAEIQQRLQKGVSPFMILATAFTRDAAREIEGRLEDEVPVRTIHGLAYWIIRLSRQARGAMVPRVISNDRSLALVTKAMKELGIKFLEPREVLKKISKVRELGDDYRNFHPQVSQVAERYFEILNSEKLVDFTGILEIAREELNDPELRKFLRGQHIFVDEGHDVSPLTEWPILEVLMEGSEEFMMFASPSQQIYGFRGADWEKLRSEFPEDVVEEFMQDNYRSTPEIVGASSPLAGIDASEMLAVREAQGIPVLAVDALNPEMEADFIGRQVNDWLRDGISAKEIAVLARSHSKLNPVQIALRTRNIPYHLNGEHTSIFHREEAQAMLGYLQFALKPRNDVFLERIINFPPCGIGLKTKHSLRGDNYLTWNHLYKALSESSKHREQVVVRINNILELRKKIAGVVGSASSLIEMVKTVLEMSSIPAYLNSEGDFQSIRALNDLVRMCIEFGDLAQYIDYLEAEISQPREPAGIQLTTIHASKGHEWQAVLIAGFQEGLLPMDGADRREEQNLAFVGMTRAKTRLMLTLNRSYPPSSFLTKLPVRVAQWPMR